MLCTVGGERWGQERSQHGVQGDRCTGADVELSHPILRWSICAHLILDARICGTPHPAALRGPRVRAPACGWTGVFPWAAFPGSDVGDFP
eukprot:15469045-Alexandrium_andersonii.AAC.1